MHYYSYLLHAAHQRQQQEQQQQQQLKQQQQKEEQERHKLMLAVLGLVCGGADERRMLERLSLAVVALCRRKFSLLHEFRSFLSVGMRRNLLDDPGILVWIEASRLLGGNLS